MPHGGGANYIGLGGGILLDSGKQSHFHRNIIPTLNTLSTPPDSVIISHAEEAHSGGMNQFLTSFHPKQALIPRTDLRSPSYQHFLANAKKSGCKLIVPRKNQIFQVKHGASLEILHAPVELDGYGLADDSGLVIRLHWNGWRILFTGDAGFSTEMRLLESGVDLSADVIVMGRNATDYSGTTNADFPTSERIPTVWRENLQKSGITLLDQQLTGAVTIVLENGNLILTPTLSGAQTFTLSP